MLINIFSLPNFISYFCCCYGKIPGKKQIKREKICLLAFNQARGCPPSVLAHRKQRKVDLCEFKVDLVYSVSYEPIKAEE